MNYKPAINMTTLRVNHCRQWLRHLDSTAADHLGGVHPIPGIFRLPGQIGILTSNRKETYQ